MTIISDNVDARVFNAYKMERAKIKRALQKSRRGNATGNIVTASMQRQNARHNVMHAMADDVFEATGYELTHRVIKDIVQERDTMLNER